MGHSRANAHPLGKHRHARLLVAGAMAASALAIAAAPSLADDSNTDSLNAVSSTGGVATAEGSSSVQTGDIITGMNTGHTVETGGTTDGDLNVSVAEMSSESNLDFVAEVGAQIADASGGDDGEASTSPGSDPPNYNVNIKNNNKSSATGIGEGGQGGTGGSGGDVTVNNP